MKKMKQKKVLEQSLCGVLALLVFAACAETSVEYGTPTIFSISNEKVTLICSPCCSEK